MNNQLATTNGHNEVNIVQMGQLMAQSGFFADTRQAAQAVVKIQAGKELGFAPVQSMMGIHIIKGKVSLSSNLMAAAIKRSGKYTYRHEKFDEKVCHLKFYEGGTFIGDSVFTMDDAKTAGLTGSDNYKKFPRNMLFSRALSNGAKWYCPDIFGGPIYTPDELGELVDGETGEVITTTSVVVAESPEPAKPAPPASIKAQAANAVKAWSGMPSSDLAAAVRAIIEACGIKLDPDQKLTDEQWSLVLDFVTTKQAEGVDFVEATTPANQEISA
jgi:hypothetical protein